MNPPTERLNNLVRLGYTPEESLFLYIVATHSGYFTHRQFLDFSGTKPGKHSQKFLAKLLSEKHATYHTYQSGGRVYHVFSRTIFKAINGDDLRTRRRHQLDYIKTRLIVLDFVLSNRDHDYLETEAEKVPFFENTMKVSGDLLPSRVYASKVSASRTTRYFVDRFPIFVKKTTAGSPMIGFTFVDPESPTLKAFGTHLQAYRGLLRSLRQFEFIYLAPSDRLFQAAEAEFSRIVLGRFTATSGEELFKYFRLRKGWEAGQRVAAAEVVFLNAAKRQFSDKTVEALYKKWIEGQVKDKEVCSPQANPMPEISGSFKAQKCGDSLSVFSRVREDLGERRAEISGERLSPSFSREISQS
jgi:hypothetical protein